MTRSDSPFPEIATGDLDVAIIGQLLAANLLLSDEFEPSPVKVVALETPFRRGASGSRIWKNAPRNPHHPLIFAHPDAELHRSRRSEKVRSIVMASHGRRGVSAVVLGSETVKVLTHSNIPVLVYR